jgi:Tol biopolymer transport system component
MNPKILFSNWRCRILAALLFSPVCLSNATGLQLVSVMSSSINAPAGANGDSGLTIVSADGHYVLFSSTADNLVSGPMPGLALRPLNVFLRDRASGTTALVSVNLAGTGGNGDSLPCGISTNGRYALFTSTAGDLVPGDTNNAGDVFVRDLVNGTTTLVSVSTNGASGSGTSRNPAMTPDGRYVAFVSTATNLVANDTNGIPDVFIRDLQAGTTALVSVGAKSAASTTIQSSSESPEITPDGRYVAFFSAATNLVSGVTLVGEVYVRDLAAGTTIWASTNARSLFQSVAGTADGISCNQVISTDGQFVAFETCPNSVTSFNARGIVLRYNLQTHLTDIVHTNANVPFPASYADINNLDMTPDGRFIALVANGVGSTGKTVIYLWDAQTATNTLVSADLTTGLPVSGICAAPVVNPTGQYVAFLCNATNLTANTLTGGYDLYLRDTQAGTTQLVDADTNGVGIGVDPAIIPALSGDGNTVAFEGMDGNLVPDDRNHDWDVFARNLATGTTGLISAHDPALPSQSPNGLSTLFSSSVSTNGRYVAFASGADNLVVNDTNGCCDVFVRDFLLGTNTLVSVATNGSSASGISTEPAISGDGRFVAFSSNATNLVAGDTNNA